MTVESVSSTSTSSSQSAISSTTLADDFDTFLTLLTTQLQYQDPLDPTDTTEFTNQLVNFAGVEQQINTNANLETMIALQEDQQVSNAVSYLGTRVEFQGGDLALQDGAAQFSYTLGDNAATCIISIFDASGNLVTSANGSTTAGTSNIVWDGLDANGNQWADGAYTVKVNAYDASYNAIDTVVESSGIVTGVTTNADGEIVLSLGDVQLSLTEVSAIKTGSAATTTASTSTDASTWDSFMDYLSSLTSTDTTTEEETTSAS